MKPRTHAAIVLLELICLCSFLEPALCSNSNPTAITGSQYTAATVPIVIGSITDTVLKIEIDSSALTPTATMHVKIIFTQNLIAPLEDAYALMLSFFYADEALVGDVQINSVNGWTAWGFGAMPTPYNNVTLILSGNTITVYAQNNLINFEIGGFGTHVDVGTAATTFMQNIAIFSNGETYSGTQHLKYSFTAQGSISNDFTEAAIIIFPLWIVMFFIYILMILNCQNNFDFIWKSTIAFIVLSLVLLISANLILTL